MLGFFLAVLFTSTALERIDGASALSYLYESIATLLSLSFLMLWSIDRTSLTLIAVCIHLFSAIGHLEFLKKKKNTSDDKDDIRPYDPRLRETLFWLPMKWSRL